MLHKHQLKKNTEGFTIIEVLIVLAIAALILLIVFLAVPALQRSSRNNSRKNDASRVSTAVANFVSNNNGSLPGAETGALVQGTWATDCSTIAADVGQLSIYGSGTPSLNSWCSQAAAFTANKVTAEYGSVATITPGANFGGDAMMLDEDATCPTTTTTSATPLIGNTRQVALFYTLETSTPGTYDVACIQAS